LPFDDLQLSRDKGLQLRRLRESVHSAIAAPASAFPNS
jgi:hypothetical protein